MTDKSTSTVTRDFTEDHVRIDELFEEARQRADANDLAGATDAFRRFQLQLAHHISVEEKKLFPLFDARAGMRGPTTMMTHEHRELEHLIMRAATSLERADAATFTEDAASLSSLLAAHNLKEERVLYPRADTVLSVGERAELGSALRGT